MAKRKPSLGEAAAGFLTEQAISDEKRSWRKRTRVKLHLHIVHDGIGMNREFVIEDSRFPNLPNRMSAAKATKWLNAAKRKGFKVDLYRETITRERLL